MAASEAQKRASKKYNEDKVESIYVRVPKGEKDVIKAHAETKGESVNEFVIRAIRETMERDNK